MLPSRNDVGNPGPLLDRIGERCRLGRRDPRSRRSDPVVAVRLASATVVGFRLGKLADNRQAARAWPAIKARCSRDKGRLPADELSPAQGHR